MKKLLAILLAVALAFTLAACGGSGSSSSADPGSSPAEGGDGKPADFPKSTITFICPWDAGGSSDAMTRVVAELGNQYFGVNCVVQNSGGAGGTVATTEFKTTAADGYTICMEAIGVFTLQPFTREVGYSIDDFIPVTALTNEPIIMVAGKDTGIKSVEDLLKATDITYGFSGSGSLMELSQKLFFEEAGLEATGISYDGASPTIAALLGGHIDIAAGHPAEVMQYIENGDVYPIGIFGGERDTRDGIKDIPTFKEQGYDIEMSVWKFMIVPKDTPAEIVDYLTTTLDQITSDPKFTEFCANNNLLPIKMTADEMLERIAAEAEVNKALLGK